MKFEKYNSYKIKNNYFQNLKIDFFLEFYHINIIITFINDKHYVLAFYNDRLNRL